MDNSIEQARKKKKLVNLLIVLIAVCIGLGTIIMVYAVKASTGYIDINETVFIQLDKPVDGQEIAIFDTSEGVMKAVLYPDQCPETVSHFIQNVEDGLYNNTSWLEVEKNSYFLCGTEGGISEKVGKNEIHKDLWPLRGAICAVSDKNGWYGDSLMFIDSIEFTDEVKYSLSSENKDNMNRYEFIITNDELNQVFFDNGGIPNFSHQYTVFAQVYEGLDVLSKISGIDYDRENHTSSRDMTINSITIDKYITE